MYCQWALGTGHWVLGTEHWVLGTVHWKLGTEHRAWKLCCHCIDGGPEARQKIAITLPSVEKMEIVLPLY
jgi:hypothetical protein